VAGMQFFGHGHVILDSQRLKLKKKENCHVSDIFLKKRLNKKIKTKQKNEIK